MASKLKKTQITPTAILRLGRELEKANGHVVLVTRPGAKYLIGNETTTLFGVDVDALLQIVSYAKADHYKRQLGEIRKRRPRWPLHKRVPSSQYMGCAFYKAKFL